MNDRRLSSVDRSKIQNHISWIQTILKKYSHFDDTKNIYPEDISLCVDCVNYLDQLINDITVEFHPNNCSEIRETCVTLKKKLSTTDEWFDTDTVDVTLMMLPTSLTICGYSFVRCIVASTFHNRILNLDWPVDDSGFDAIQTYTRMKNYIYDKLPDNISHEWLMEHGFTIF